MLGFIGKSLITRQLPKSFRKLITNWEFKEPVKKASGFTGQELIGNNLIVNKNNRRFKMVSIWWLVIIVPVAVMIGLSATAITSANKFADLYDEIILLKKEIENKKELIEKQRIAIAQLNMKMKNKLNKQIIKSLEGQ
jgi:hypothetical protein